MCKRYNLHVKMILTISRTQLVYYVLRYPHTLIIPFIRYHMIRQDTAFIQIYKRQDV
jgi:hypothetical protein